MRYSLLSLVLALPLLMPAAAAQACERENTPSSRVVNGPNGTTYIFHEANDDTEIVPPDGSVTTVVHDPDYTKTIVGPNGVRIETDDEHTHDWEDDPD